MDTHHHSVLQEIEAILKTPHVDLLLSPSLLDTLHNAHSSILQLLPPTSLPKHHPTTPTPNQPKRKQTQQLLPPPTTKKRKTNKKIPSQLTTRPVPTLPPEVWVNITQYLCHSFRARVFQFVCKKWRQFYVMVTTSATIQKQTQPQHCVQLLKVLSKTFSLKKLTLPQTVTEQVLKNVPMTVRELHLLPHTDVHVLQHLPQALLHLNLQRCYQITNQCLQHLPHSLQHLDLGHCNQITDKGLQHLPHSLLYLDLSCCDKITYEYLQYLPHSLQYLALCGWKITDEGLRHLPPKLQHLDLSWCDKITNKGLQHLPYSLQSLYLRDCRQFEHNGVISPHLPQTLAHVKVVSELCE